MPLNAKLVVVGGDVKTTEIKLKLPSTIGRGRGTAIVLPHPLVSRQHCELFEADGQLMVRDLGSLNGTFVNNQRVTESPIPPGELLTIGTVTFRAVYELAGQPAPGSVTQVTSIASQKTVQIERTESDEEVLPALNGENEDEQPFDFSHELLPPGQETQIGQRDSQNKTEPLPSKPPAGKSADNRPAKPGTEDPPDATVDFAKWGEDDEVADAASSDEDLDDFLKGLQK
jgi:pSer/pThr/pTyr-binding forkhead associated (FHA) protein